MRTNYSMETALIAIVNRLLENQDSSHANGMIFADFQKAFDLVDHSVLIKKSRIYGLNCNATELTSSYLSGLKRATDVNGKVSSFQLLPDTVPPRFGACSTSILCLHQWSASWSDWSEYNGRYLCGRHLYEFLYSHIRLRHIEVLIKSWHFMIMLKACVANWHNAQEYWGQVSPS